MVVELHSNMRFAWLRKNSGGQTPAKLKAAHPLNLIYLAYNAIYWLPIILSFTGVIDYRAGFIAFLAIIAVRSTANIVRNNVLKPERAEIFPLRS